MLLGRKSYRMCRNSMVISFGGAKCFSNNERAKTFCALVRWVNIVSLLVLVGLISLKLGMSRGSLVLIFSFDRVTNFRSPPLMDGRIAFERNVCRWSLESMQRSRKTVKFWLLLAIKGFRTTIVWLILYGKYFQSFLLLWKSWPL